MAPPTIAPDRPYLASVAELIPVGGTLVVAVVQLPDGERYSIVLPRRLGSTSTVRLGVAAAVTLARTRGFTL